MKEKCGVIYILTNPSFPEYIKIGYADDVELRVKQLNNSEAVPFSFHTTDGRHHPRPFCHRSAAVRRRKRLWHSFRR